jgi:hypothetical protein
MSREDLAQEWRERLDDFAQADTTIVEWCYFHRIPVHQFHYWKRRLASAPPHTEATPQFIPVEITQAASSPAVATGVTVRIAGAAIELAANFDPATLRAVVAVLSALPC